MLSKTVCATIAGLASVAAAAPAAGYSAVTHDEDHMSQSWVERFAAPGRAQQNVVDQYSWNSGMTRAYPIHQSCNATETALLEQAFAEMAVLAAHARDHILRFGNSSSFFTKYFGKATTGEPAGWLDKIVNGDKSGVLFRCDDIDGNCWQDGWAGHWRGENATDETVICEMSYTSRWPLAGLCGYGYTVAAEKTTAYFASDLMHRVYHTDKIGESVVGHYADTYEECLQLAKDSPEEAVRNSATLRYFALDVYAYDIAVPGQGCTGEPVPEEEDDHSHDSATSNSSSMSASPTASMTSSSMESVPTADAATTATTATSAESAEATEASSTTSAEVECHTHNGGEVHCVEESESDEADSTATAASAQETESSSTTTAGAECHTHANGEEHCV
ncbi:zincin [Hortaea werneckii]|nr:zincin [Hortaea werneckii]